MGLLTPPHENYLVTETNTRDQAIVGNWDEALQENGQIVHDSQTQKGAGTTMVDSLKPKTRTKVSRLSANLSSKYKLDILGVSKARWTRTRKRKLQAGHTILYSGRPDDQHTEGVSLIISRMVKAPLESCLVLMRRWGSVRIRRETQQQLGFCQLAAGGN